MQYDQEVITRAIQMIKETSAAKGDAFTNPKMVKEFCVLKLAKEEREHFLVMFMDNRHQLISDEIMFSGTIDGASVYAREVIKRALQLNAAALIFAHNHPSGTPEPSAADQRLTQQLVKCCDLMDIRVLDHIVVGGTETVSFAERGLL